MIRESASNTLVLVTTKSPWEVEEFVCGTENGSDMLTLCPAIFLWCWGRSSFFAGVDRGVGKGCR
jgi:hypothetical protein